MTDHIGRSDREGEYFEEASKLRCELSVWQVRIMKVLLFMASTCLSVSWFPLIGKRMERVGVKVFSLAMRPAGGKLPVYKRRPPRREDAERAYTDTPDPF